MRALLNKDITNFLKRFGKFVDAEIRSIDIISATFVKLIIACQDKARAFDWITIELEFKDVSGAKLIDNSKLSLLDMSNGISLLKKENKFYFAIDNYTSISSIKNSILYVCSSNLKYKENKF